MRKVVLDLAVTLDGYIEGSNGEIDWCIMDDDMDFDGFLSTIDTIFYGRVSYDLWGNFQPEKNASETELNFGKEFTQRESMYFQNKTDKTKMQHLSVLEFRTK
jgi:dihydrofolate reductase